MMKSLRSTRNSTGRITQNPQITTDEFAPSSDSRKRLSNSQMLDELIQTDKKDKTPQKSKESQLLSMSPDISSPLASSVIAHRMTSPELSSLPSSSTSTPVSHSHYSELLSCQQQIQKMEKELFSLKSEMKQLKEEKKRTEKPKKRKAIPEISILVRKAYEAILKERKGEWDTEKDSKYRSEKNQMIANLLFKYVQCSLTSEVEREDVYNAIQTYYTSKKQEASRNRNFKAKDHKISTKLYKRRLTKSKRRYDTYVDEKDSEARDKIKKRVPGVSSKKIKRALSETQLMSDSHSEEGEENVIFVEKLQWHHPDWIRIKKIVDRKARKNDSGHSKRLRRERRPGPLGKNQVPPRVAIEKHPWIVLSPEEKVAEKAVDQD